MTVSDNEDQGLQSDEEYEDDHQAIAPRQQQQQPVQQGQRTMQRPRQQPQQQSRNNPLPNGNGNEQQMMPSERISGNMGGRTGAIRESRIKDRPQPQEVRDSSLKIKIELDLEVEVDLYARVKGDICIGLM
jgi:hypothetical protein